MKLKFLYALLMTLLIFSCRKEKTTWDTDWVFPLLNDTLSIGQLINDSTLSINPNNSLQVKLKRNLLDIDLFSLVEIPDTSIFQDFSINFNQLVLPPGANYIDEVKEHEFELDGVVLLQARLQGGKAVIRIENPVETKTIFTVELPGVSRNGVIFSQTEVIPAASNGNPGVEILELDLKGYDIDMRGEDGSGYNKLQSRMTVITDPDGDSAVVTQNDVAQFFIDFIGLEVDYAKGFFGTTVISDTTEVTIDFLKKITDGQVNTEELDLTLTFSNGIKAEAQGVLTQVKSTNFNHNSINLEHPTIGDPFFINRALGSWSSLQPFQKIFHFDSENGNSKAFAEHLGHTYSIGYQVTVNPWGNNSNGTDEIFPNSRIQLDLETDFPLSVGMDNLTLVDTFSIDIAEQENALRVKSGNLELKTKNKFPFGASATLILMDENYNSIGQIATEEVIRSAPLNNAQNGHEAIEDQLIFQLTEEQAEQISEVKHIQLRLVFNTTSYPDNTVFDNAEIHVQLQTRFKLKTVL